MPQSSSRSGKTMIQATVALLLVFLSALPRGISGAKQPEQIHLSVSHRRDEVIVFWITEKSPAEGSVVMYGLSKWWLNNTATSNSVRRYSYNGVRMPGGYTSGYINKVVISGLKSDTYPMTYYYKCGDPRNGWSEVKSFRTRPMHPDAPVVVSVIGDTVSALPCIICSDLLLLVNNLPTCVDPRENYLPLVILDHRIQVSQKNRNAGAGTTVSRAQRRWTSWRC